MSLENNQNIQEDMLSRVGHMTRLLHDSLRGLGLDKLLERAAEDIPDARDRLDYVARMSEKAAQRVLNATDAAIPLQENMDEIARRLQSDIAEAQAHPSNPAVAEILERIHRDLDLVSAHSKESKAQLMEIMMAQDFQDLTGQVIKRVTELASHLEQQLVQLLIDYSPQDKKREISDGLMNGPQINPENNADVVANQGQVDDLLDSLGF